jgi:hypothetical protein
VRTRERHDGPIVDSEPSIIRRGRRPSHRTRRERCAYCGRLGRPKQPSHRVASEDQEGGIAGDETARLTPRQAVFLGNLAQGMTVTCAALRAGYSDRNPAQSGYQALKTIEHRVPALMERDGLTGDTLIQKYLVPALNATEIKTAHHAGRFIYSKPLVAWGPRLTALDFAFRISGMYQTERESAASSVRVVVTNAENRPPVVCLPRCANEETRRRLLATP